MLVTALQLAAFAVWLGYFGLSFQYAGTRPRTPDPATGRIYSINEHGAIAYLARKEELILYGSGGLALLLFGLSYVVHLRTESRRQARSIGPSSS
jgi:hypothetical protein